MKPIIEVKGLSKKYRLGEIQPYYTLRDSLAGVFKNPFAKKVPGLEKGEFWALNDVSFEVQPGEVVGIIGRNGAGKSTLLKILSQITPPTEGEVIMRGRVGSLLEVGTGFSPELTGRENIYLNGAILGMSRAEVKSRFDEIVAFSEVEKFLDTPMKRYSSGMYMRLAFAVAAHLETEILIVDEVLAVGDAEFQKKALGKMGEVTKQGRTVLFVSHNMAVVEQLCSTGIVLDSGEMRYSGTIQKTVGKYMNLGQNSLADSKDIAKKVRSKGNRIIFQSAELRNAKGASSNEFCIGDDIVINLELDISDITQKHIKVALELESIEGIKISNIISDDSKFLIPIDTSPLSITVTMTDIRLYPGQYIMNLWVGTSLISETIDYVLNGLTFTVIPGGKIAKRELPKRDGLLYLTPEWKVS